MKLFELLLEGYIKPSPDMVKFADDIAKTAEWLISNKDHEDYRKQFKLARKNNEGRVLGKITKHIDSGKYGNREITVKFVTWPRTKKAAWAENRKFNEDGKLYEFAIVVDSSTQQSIQHNAIHEMIHLFDPKLQKDKIDVGKHARKNQREILKSGDFRKYVLQPHELDAIIPTVARDLVDYLVKEEGHVEGARIALKNLDIDMLPYKLKVMIEPIKTRKAPWRKFINTVYDMLHDGA